MDQCTVCDHISVRRSKKKISKRRTCRLGEECGVHLLLCDLDVVRDGYQLLWVSALVRDDDRLAIRVLRDEDYGPTALAPENYDAELRRELTPRDRSIVPSGC